MEAKKKKAELVKVKSPCLTQRLLKHL